MPQIDPPSPLYFIANPASPHPRHWLEYTGSMPVIFYHIPRHSANGSKLPDNVKTICPLPAIAAKFPVIMQYIWLGLWLRFFAPVHFFHAHNSSGYGLSALLSGRTFGLTTYGSEIFSMPSRSRLYRAMIRKILNKAIFITATSKHMQDVVEKIIGQTDKIALFSVGVPPIFYAPKTVDRDNGPIWISNRRIHPYYHTAELIAAFIQYKNAGGGGGLALLEGDSDAQYLAQVRDQAAPYNAIEIISGFIPQQEIISHLDRASFCISAPETDQLSSSILEGAARGAIPILRPLESYKAVSSIAHFIEDSGNLEEDFLKMFQQTAAFSAAQRAEMATKARQLVTEKFSIAAAKDRYLQLLAPYHKALAS